ncbi:GerMN domain-containing protein [Treponema parvum]|uniref:GerMN domain-containing protein n=1 Tax=Treponema parvum TaxID=138851 RepID=A0A975F608_9SPIR|nr:GerMN domain-containing protein [Treponema parvum]QTQ14943.1 GerMN domain-containing protein [Treponema parvum]
MSENNKKRSGLILSCWIVAALIVLIAFMVNGNKIIGNLKSTGFFERIFGTTPEFVKNYTEKKPPKSNGLLEIEIEKPSVQGSDAPLVSGTPLAPGTHNSSQTPSEGTSEKTQGTAESTSAVTSEAKNTALNAAGESLTNVASAGQNNKQDVARNTNVSSTSVNQSGTTPSTRPQSNQASPSPSAINLRMFFVSIDTDGTISKKEVQRTSLRRDAPLTAALEALLSGPSLQERNANYMSLIPSGTRLLGASVKNGIAFLNFSEEFEYNPYGVEGYLGQLMQIVYTATSFSTVDSVQFLIEGQKKDYLGSEGVWIGSPLARSSFSK